MRIISIITGILLAACLSCAPRAVSQSQAAPTLIAGPYLQNMATDGVTIMWETKELSTGTVIVSDGKKTTRWQSNGARRIGEVGVTGLSPDTRYTYSLSVGDSNGALGSPVSGGGMSFRTFPAKKRPVKFIVYGDTRSNPERAREVVDAMAGEKDIDFVLHTGDLVGSGSDTGAWISEFFAPSRQLILDTPFYSVLGNHEGGAQRYFDYFGPERWYSFDVLDIHVIALDSNVDFDVGSKQYEWLVSDLKKHKSARWRFVVMHHPTYTSGVHGAFENGVPKERPTRVARNLLPKLAARYGINAFFAGHDHTYERSVRDGVGYIVTGGGGAPLYGGPYARNNPYRKIFHSCRHYVVVTVNDSSARAMVKTPTGRVIDRFDMK